MATLERAAAGPELAWAYALRAQTCMLQNRTGGALDWGQRAIALAERVNAPEPLCHALNSVGTAELFADRPEGRAKLMRSLELALAYRFHEQAARVYTNLGEYLVVTRDTAAAERWLDEGLAFDRRHDLDAWTYYLEGWLAQLRLDQGRLADAQQLAQAVLYRPGLTLVMRLPALTVRARAGVRRGDPAARAWLDEAHAAARDTGEVQRVVPVVLALDEDAWLRDDLVAARQALASVDAAAVAGLGGWERGELAVWRRRAGLPDLAGPAATAVALPWQLELQGQPLAAAAAWRERSAPVEAALALLQVPALQPGADILAALRDAQAGFESVGAGPGLRRTRALAGALGLQRQLPGRRGPYRAARADPDGLTAREQRVLRALADGLPNEAIAAQLGVSRRTVERHVSQVLAKLGVSSRAEAARHARRRAP